MLNMNPFHKILLINKIMMGFVNGFYL